MLRLHKKMISTRVSFLVVLTFINITLENSDATLVDLLNDVKNKLAELQAGEVKLQKEVEALVKNGINATGIEEEVHDVDKTVAKILHHVAGSDGETTPTTVPIVTPTTTYLELIQNTGTAGSSSDYRAAYSAKHAFMSSADHWSNTKNQFPAAVWMRFPSSHVLAKIGYLALYDEDTPPKMEVIGSDDCSTWTILLNLENIVNTHNNKFREWSIPSQNRVPFSCIGLRWPAAKLGSNTLYISQITMWELK